MTDKKNDHVAETPAEVKKDKPTKAVAKPVEPKVTEKKTKAVTKVDDDWVEDRGASPKNFNTDPAWKPIRYPELVDNSPQVVISGVAIDPIATGLRADSGALIAGKHSLYLPYPVTRFNELTFNVYEVTDPIRGHTVVLFMDPASKLIFDAPRGREDVLYDILDGRITKQVASVLMVNSFSQNDTFIGDENKLINVDSRHNVINQSTLEATVRSAGRMYTPFDGQRQIDHFIPGVTNRHRYERSRFKKTTVRDCILAEGYYLESHLTSSTIRVGRRADVVNCMIMQSLIDAGDLYLRKVNCNETQLVASGSIRVLGQTIDRLTVSAKGVHFPHKFCSTVITSPGYEDFQLIRTGLTEYELGTGWRSTVIHRDDDRLTIFDKVLELVKASRPGEEDSPTKSVVTGREPRLDNLTSSVLRYIADCVVSRLRIIATLDAALETARQLTGDERSVFNSPYEL